MIWLVRMIGALAFLVIAVAVWMAVVSYQFDPAELSAELTGGFKKPVMAMEFAQNAEQVGVILDQKEKKNREVMRKEMYLDFIWIACYGLLFVAVSVLLAQRQHPWSVYLAFVAAVCGVGAAGFDVMENLGILRVLNAPAITQQMVNDIRDAALVKWTLCFVAMALLATAFYGLGRRITWIGYAFTATAIVGFIGLWHKPLIGLMALPMLIGLLLLFVRSFTDTEKFLEKPDGTATSARRLTRSNI
jgi:hypothetical protein